VGNFHNDSQDTVSNNHIPDFRLLEKGVVEHKITPSLPIIAGVTVPYATVALGFDLGCLKSPQYRFTAAMS
jgi:hypothetical protein